MKSINAQSGFLKAAIKPPRLDFPGSGQAIRRSRPNLTRYSVRTPEDLGKNFNGPLYGHGHNGPWLESRFFILSSVCSQAGVGQLKGMGERDRHNNAGQALLDPDWEIPTGDLLNVYPIKSKPGWHAYNSRERNHKVLRNGA